VEEDEISLLQLFSVMLRRRWTIVWSTAIITLVALALALQTQKVYTASTSFIPQGSESRTSGLAGLAGQFGFQLPSQSSSESPQFYAELVTSREILGTLAVERVSFPVSDGSLDGRLEGFLPELLEMGEGDVPPLVLRETTIQWLRGAVSASPGRETGIVGVSITTPWPGLSKVLADRLLELLNEFNLQTRQSQAAAEREFVENRLAEVQDSLRAAEDRLETFLEANRLWENSPELSFQQGRLLRQVTMQQQVYTSLAEAHEQARIAEVRNTPVITIVERPEAPVYADARRRLMKLALGIVLGGMLGVFLAFGQEYLQRARKEEGEEYEEFSSLWAQTWRDIRTFGGLFGRKKQA
jgi:uncharacterized protein involved in exopolysaccharide biosynthesis